MIEYTKIRAVFNRDTNGSKKLIEGDYCDEAVEFLKYNQWSCTEKIDGTNIGIVWDGHRVSYQGRTEAAQLPPHLVTKLQELFGGDINEQLFEQKFGETPAVLFGEGYGPKIQNGGAYRSDVSFILFDVYLPVTDLWLRRDAIEDVARFFGVDVVPVIMTGTLEEAVAFVKTKPKSTIGSANMEGLVCKPLVDMLDRRGRRIIVKVKARDFS